MDSALLLQIKIGLNYKIELQKYWITKIYINSDVAEQLKIKDTPKQVTANVFNNQVKTFETLPVESKPEYFHEKKVDVQLLWFQKTWDQLTRKKIKEEWMHLNSI